MQRAASERLFFALRPDAATALCIHGLAMQLRTRYGLRAKPLAIERLHLTLCFLGSHAGLSPQQLAAADDLGRSVRQERFELTFDRVECLGSSPGAPVVLTRQVCGQPLRQLHDGLIARAARTGLFEVDTRPFKPHVTLLYTEKSLAAQAVEPVSWTASEMLLIRSHIGRPQHDVLGCYPLVTEP